MFTFMSCLFLFVSLLSPILAVPLTPRDVVDPPITSPTAGTVWHVGQTETVTWKTTGLPVNQTNPVGRLVLGYLSNNSENLMLDSPLATGLNYSVGQAQITVPDVPTRDDYIVVLFGDSGNASPQFTIINDASSPVSPPPLTAIASTPASDSSSVHLHPTTSGGPPPNPRPTSPTAPTTPGGRTTSRTSSTVVATSSSTPPSTLTGTAWRNHVPSLGTSFSVAFAVVYFAL